MQFIRGLRNKTKTAPVLQWVKGVGFQMTAQSGNLMVSCDLDRDKRWRFAVYKNGREVGKSRPSGYRRREAATVSAEAVVAKLLEVK